MSITERHAAGNACDDKPDCGRCGEVAQASHSTSVLDARAAASEAIADELMIDIDRGAEL